MINELNETSICIDGNYNGPSQSEYKNACDVYYWGYQQCSIGGAAFFYTLIAVAVVVLLCLILCCVCCIKKCFCEERKVGDDVELGNRKKKDSFTTQRSERLKDLVQKGNMEEQGTDYKSMQAGSDTQEKTSSSSIKKTSSISNQQQNDTSKHSDYGVPEQAKSMRVHNESGSEDDVPSYDPNLALPPAPVAPTVDDSEDEEKPQTPVESPPKTGGLYPKLDD
jgi:FtsZ-interacting cell division protein ZipA